MHRDVETAFRVGNKTVRWAMYSKSGDRPVLILYHTPVTESLKKSGEKLGNYLHCMKKFYKEEDAWWTQFRQELESVTFQLRLATSGTLLGPPLMKPETNKIDMKLEIPPGYEADSILSEIANGRETTLKVSYHDSLPDRIEKEAVIWWEHS